MNWKTFHDPACKYFGTWQEDEAGALASYWSVACMEVGFTGTLLCLDADVRGDVRFWLDGAVCIPETTAEGLVFRAVAGSHALRLRVAPKSRLTLRRVGAAEEGELYRTPRRPYVEFIGDSIFNNGIGCRDAMTEYLRADYSLAARPGMALTDGWGWYPLPEGYEKRPGMETSYFLAGEPRPGVQPYRFAYTETPDIIVIFLGTNDYLDTPAARDAGHVGIFAEHYLKFVRRLRERAPGARIFMLKALSDKCCRNEGITAAYRKIAAELADVTLIESDTWQVEIEEEDKTHPTDAGYRRLVERLAGVLNGALDRPK